MDVEEVGLLRAERDVERLVLTYCRGVDRLDQALLRSVFHDDALFDYGNGYRGGPDGLCSWVLGHVATRFLSTMHGVQQVLTHVEGDVARAETYCVAHHVRRDGGELVLDTFGCRYLDDVERRPGTGWRILRRVVVREWQTRQRALSESEASPGFVAGRRDAGDLVYAPLLPVPSPTPLL